MNCTLKSISSASDLKGKGEPPRCGKASLGCNKASERTLENSTIPSRHHAGQAVVLENTREFSIEILHVLIHTMECK